MTANEGSWYCSIIFVCVDSGITRHLTGESKGVCLLIRNNPPFLIISCGNICLHLLFNDGVTFSNLKDLLFSMMVIICEMTGSLSYSSLFVISRLVWIEFRAYVLTRNWIRTLSKSLKYCNLKLYSCSIYKLLVTIFPTFHQDFKATPDIYRHYLIQKIFR